MNNVPNNVPTGTPNNAPASIVKKLGNMALVAIAAQVLGAIFTFLGTITASASGYGMSISDSGNMFSMDDGFITVLAILVLVGFLAAAACTYLGVNKAQMKLYALVANGVAVLALIVAMFYIPSLAPSEAGFKMSVGFGVLGYIHLVFGLGSAVLTYFNYAGKKLF